MSRLQLVERLCGITAGMSASNVAELRSVCEELRYSDDEPRDPQGKWTGGGSVDTKADVAYARELSSELKKKYEDGDKSRDAVSALGFRTDHEDEAFALAKHMEEASSREAMLESLSSGMMWNTYPDTDIKEWQAARELGGNESVSTVTRDSLRSSTPLTEDEKKAFAARMEFVQTQVAKEEGEEFTVYRGVKGVYAQKIKGNKEFDLPVRGLASFTTNKIYARDFAGKNGVVVSAKIKASDVFWTNESGPSRIVNYTDDRGEKVVLCKSPTMKVSVYDQLSRSIDRRSKVFYSPTMVSEQNYLEGFLNG